MKDEKMVSLNQELNTELVINELEQRLETDPLIAFGPELSTTDTSVMSTCFNCGEFL